MPLAPPLPRLPPHTAVRAFEAAARLGSFARAADELCVTPAAVSQQVKALEAWAGGALFERHAQGIRLSAHARRVLPALSAAIDQLGVAVQALRCEAPAAAARGALHVAALPALAQLWLAPRLSALKRRLPGVQVSVSALERPPNFRREPFDLGLFYVNRRDPPWPDDVQALVLAQDRLLPVCSPRLLGAARRPRALDTLHALRERHGSLHDAVWDDDWTRWLRAVQPTLAVHDARTQAAGAQFSLYSLALQAAIDGEGLLMGREQLVAAALAQGRLHAPWGRAKALGDAIVLAVPRHRARAVLPSAIAALQALAAV